MDELKIETPDNLAATVRDIVKAGFEPRTVMVKGFESENSLPIEVLILPDGSGGLTAQSVKPFCKEWWNRPERREGIARFDALDSFIDHVTRFADKHSALFAKGEPGCPSIQAVLDYHEKTDAGEPRFGAHRSLHGFPLADEWKAWMARANAPMNQQEFAEFLEDRIADVIVPDAPLLDAIKERGAGGDFGEKTPVEMLADYARLIGGDFASPSRLVEISRGLAVHADHAVKQAVTVQSGEVQVQFVETHSDSDGKPIKVPALFLIAIPVFLHGDLYRVAVRLRYRVREGRIFWHFELYRADKIFDAAFREACEKAAEATKLPLFYGSPEESR